MKKRSNISRLLYILPFGTAGVLHFTLTGSYLPILRETFLLAQSGYLVLFAGLILILTSLNIMFNWFTRLSCIILTLLLFTFIVTIHIPGLFGKDPSRVHLSIINLIKNTSLMGGSQMIYSLYKNNKETVF